LINM